MTDSTLHTSPAALPGVAPFPMPGTSPFDAVLDHLRGGRLVTGVTATGEFDTWDLDAVSVGVIHGRPGTGKTVTLTGFAVQALCLPDEVDLVILDPHRTLEWAAEFPNVRRYAADNDAIAVALEEVRAVIAARAAVSHPREPVTRVIVLYDDADTGPITAAESGEERPPAALEVIAALGRSVDVALIAAMSTLNRTRLPVDDNMGVAVCLGPADPRITAQLLGDASRDLLRDGDAAVPPGRARIYTRAGDHRRVQVLHPANAGAPGEKAAGTVRQRLTDLGYRRVTDDAGKPRWIAPTPHYDSGSDVSVDAPSPTVVGGV